jgi:hypothetical protein
MKRNEPLRSIKHSKSGARPEFVIKTRLVVDGTMRDYIIILEDDLTVVEFWPDRWLQRGGEKGQLGIDDRVKDARRRSLAIGAVEQLNKHLKFTYHGPPKILEWDNDLLVTYRTITEQKQDQEEHRRGVVIMHPWVSFVVSPRGTPFAAFWGL